jgi:transposase-like protein
MAARVEHADVDRAFDQHGQVIDVLVWTRRNAPAAGALFTLRCAIGPTPVEITTDRVPLYPRIVDEQVAPDARHVTERYATNEKSTAGGRVLFCAAFLARCSWLTTGGGAVLT